MHGGGTELRPLRGAVRLLQRPTEPHKGGGGGGAAGGGAGGAAAGAGGVAAAHYDADTMGGMELGGGPVAWDQPAGRLAVRGAPLPALEVRLELSIGRIEHAVSWRVDCKRFRCRRPIALIMLLSWRWK